jgi:iron complex outermembrane recepter protein
MNTLSRSTLTLAILGSTTAFAAETSTKTTPSNNATLEEVTVTADFREVDLLKSANSISVIDAQAIARREAKHLDQILNTAPNVNFAAGASRGRFIQVRGIGERSQFKDPLDASVGMVIDGIDYSGIGLASLLNDVKQVDILRGPQGTQFGASAMAGMVNIKSNKPSEDFKGKFTAGVGNYDTYETALMLNGAITDKVLGRISIGKNTSDGYIDNDFLNKDDTNNIDETSVKAQLTWLASNTLEIDLTTHYIDTDNGYNAFSLSNSRDIPTDDPGHDRQKTKAAALAINWQANDAFNLQATLSGEHSDIEYGFDWDWTNLNDGGARGREDNKRKRKSYAFDMRFISKPGSEILGGADWVAGLYASDRKVRLKYNDSWEDILWGGPYLSSFDNKFKSERQSIYGQLHWSLNDNFSLTTGLRLENYENDYSDSVGVIEKEEDDLWGGKVTLEYTGLTHTLVYATVSRGYKIGGVNGQAVGKVLSDPGTPANIASYLTSRSTFDSETLINYELGIKGRYFDNRLSLAATIFYMDRKDMQANVAILFPPTEWKSYLDNIDDGHNAGIEIQAQWLASDKITLFANIGWLDTELGELTVRDIDSGNTLNQSGREQAHAPKYQFNIGSTIKLLDNLSLTAEVDGKDKFYFSNSHNEESESYNLVHMTLAYQQDNLSISLWGRNLTDKDYETRGFYFDNTGPAYDGSNIKGYQQLGEPRTYGVNASYSF